MRACVPVPPKQVPPEVDAALVAQLDADCAFLASQQIMDYSLLVGISWGDIGAAGGGGGGRGEQHAGGAAPPSAPPPTGQPFGLRSRFRAHRGGLRASTPQGSGPEPVAYYVGIIDVLQR